MRSSWQLSVQTVESEQTAETSATLPPSRHFSPSTLAPFPAYMIGAILVANIGISSVISISLA